MITEIERQYLLDNYVNRGALFCSQQLNLQYKKIIYEAGRLKLKASKSCRAVVSSASAIKWQSNRTYDDYSVNPTPFINPTTKEICYLLGLLWADGNIRPQPNNSICLEILSNDAKDIQYLFEQTGKWSINTRQRCHYKPTTSIRVSNPIIHKFLEDNQYRQKSIVSPDLILQQIPIDLVKYFVRGVLDGDGNIYINPHNVRFYQVTFAGSYTQRWDYLLKISQQLNIGYNINRRSKINPKTNKLNQYSAFRFTGRNNVLKFLDYIYGDYDNIGFTRKYQKYLEIKNH